MKTIKIYSMQQCPYCKAAKQLLNLRGVPFEEIILHEEDDAQWDALIKKSGLKTVPQIFFGDQLIGGFDDLARLDSQDGLKTYKKIA